MLDQGDIPEEKRRYAKKIGNIFKIVPGLPVKDTKYTLMSLRTTEGSAAIPTRNLKLAT